MKPPYKIKLPKVKFVKTNKGVAYGEIESGFDIETTSMYGNGKEKFAFMYVWAFGIGDKEQEYCYGRTWQEFQQLCNYLVRFYKLTLKKRLVIYVHNLGYEFEFMKHYFQWEQVFSIKSRKPIKAVTVDGIEFRDSYILSGLNLELTAKNLNNHKLEKLVGDLDYQLIRHEQTPLTEQELKYLQYDVKIILAFINEELEEFKSISNIPMTKTGKVRRYVKHNCFFTDTNHKKSNKGKYTRYRDLMKSLKLDPQEYQQLQRAFQGGFTHANAMYNGQIMKNVTSVDFTSSYPSVMLAEQYPMSSGQLIDVDSIGKLEELIQNYCCLFNVKLVNVESKILQDNYLSESKCKTVNAVVNNGRIYKADEVVTTITDIDYRIIKACYNYENIAVSEVRIYKRGYLPKPIIESILELFEMKTVLKGVKGKEKEYLVSKGMLNSVYGMAVTNIVRDEIIYNENDGWTETQADLTEEVEKYNKKKDRFLFYPWGIWVTAYARFNLWSGILAFETDYIYSDTDSIKVLNYDDHQEYIERYNNNVIEKHKRCLNYYNLDLSKLEQRTSKGELSIMGLWDFDGYYPMFKTLGAKRYLTFDGEEMQMTVAGLSKKDGLKYLQEISDDDVIKTFNNFTNEMYIPSERTSKNTHTYIDEEQTYFVTDYKGNTKEVTSLSGVHLEKADFTLSIGKRYAEFLRNLKDGYLYIGGGIFEQ